MKAVVIYGPPRITRKSCHNDLITTAGQSGMLRYRPNWSVRHALAVAHKHCWHRDWVIDLNIKGFFDNLDH